LKHSNDNSESTKLKILLLIKLAMNIQMIGTYELQLIDVPLKGIENQFRLTRSGCGRTHNRGSAAFFLIIVVICCGAGFQTIRQGTLMIQ
jgi:hypothetical protein